MATITLTQARNRIQNELGLGFQIANGFITAIAAQSVTVPNYFQNTDIAPSTFQNRGTGIFRPTADSSAGYWRKASTLTTSSGLLAHAGLAYTDTTVGTETLEIWDFLKEGVRPDVEVLAALNRALEDCYMDSCFEALSHGIDLDYSMIASTDTNWTDVGTPTTSAKSTTGRRTPYGARSYRLVADAANEGTQSATVPWDAGEEISCWTIASADSGIASMAPYDVTGSAAFGTQVTYSGEETMFLRQNWVSPPASSEEGAVQLLGTVNPSDVYFNGLWLYKRNQLWMNLPSHASEGFKVTGIYRASMRNEVATNTYRAMGIDIDHPLVEKEDYRLVIAHGDANPYRVIFANTSYFEEPLFLQTRRPHSDTETLSTEASTTTAPLNLFIPRAKMEILDNCVNKAAYGMETWAVERGKAAMEWTKAQVARPITDPAPRPYYAGIGPRI